MFADSRPYFLDHHHELRHAVDVDFDLGMYRMGIQRHVST